MTERQRMGIIKELATLRAALKELKTDRDEWKRRAVLAESWQMASYVSPCEDTGKVKP